MQRRHFCGTLGGLAVLPRSGQAQLVQRKVRIVVLGGGVGLADPNVVRNMVDPLRAGLRQLGHVEGQNLQLEFRFAEGQPERLPMLLAESIALAPDVLVTSGPRPPLLAKEATRTIPIVAVAIDDPVQMGLAESYARPGGNITGVSLAFSGILEKRLQLLKDIVPAARRFAVLMNPHTLARAELERSLVNDRRGLGMQIVAFEARGPDDFDAVFAAMARDRVDAVAILADATFYAHRQRLGELVVKHRLPSAWGHKDYLQAGGLVSFQGDLAELFRRSASLIDKIVKGANPGDLPFEQSTKFDLVLNLKAAKALGLKVPQSVLVSADEVLE